MKIAYITAHTPFGRGENFVLEEMLAMVELGAEILIVPRNPPREVFHSMAQRLEGRATWLPLLDRRIFLRFMKALFSKSGVWRLLRIAAGESRSLKIFFKNLAVVPKAIFVTDSMKRNGVDHIHAHWGSTTSTMAWIISELTGIPWSLTLHRWDIAENNMLRLKVDRADFARSISESGRLEVLDIVGDKYQGKVQLIHVGVRGTSNAAKRSRELSSKFTIACPANLLPKKGHRFLIEACSLLRKQGIKDFECILIGDGPLEPELHRQVAKAGLQGTVRIIGALPHERLIALYERGEVHAVVLPSVVTAKGDKEGIPVTLMEAMSFGIPVVSTDTGGIPELLADGAGIMVEQKNPRQLADVLEGLIVDGGGTEELIEKGRRRIEEQFDLVGNARRLLRMMQHSNR